MHFKYSNFHTLEFVPNPICSSRSYFAFCLWALCTPSSGVLILWLSTGVWQRGPKGTGRWGYICLLLSSYQVASGWPPPFTKLDFSMQGPLCYESRSPFSLLGPGVIIALLLLNQVTELPFANSPFVNKPSWNDPHLQVPSVSYWDCGWYRFNSHDCEQKREAKQSIKVDYRKCCLPGLMCSTQKQSPLFYGA